MEIVFLPVTDKTLPSIKTLFSQIQRIAIIQKMPDDGSGIPD